MDARAPKTFRRVNNSWESSGSYDENWNSPTMSYEDPISPPPAQARPAAQAWETTKEKAGEALQTGERYVRENPGASVLSIFGLGVVVGLLVGYGIAHEDRDDYSASARKFLKQWGRKMNLD